jgi:hypothetical protein
VAEKVEMRVLRNFDGLAHASNGPVAPIAFPPPEHRGVGILGNRSLRSTEFGQKRESCGEDDRWDSSLHRVHAAQRSGSAVGRAADRPLQPVDSHGGPLWSLRS